MYGHWKVENVVTPEDSEATQNGLQDMIGKNTTLTYKKKKKKGKKRLHH